MGAGDGGVSIFGSRYRLLRHAWVLLAAALLLLLVPRATTQASANALAVPHPAGAIILSATIERPSLTPVLATQPAQTLVAAPGQTVESMASEHHSDTAAIRWANGLDSGAQPTAGTTLLLPPGPGALVAVVSGERPSQFAKRLGLDPRVVLDYNALTTDAPRPPGSYLQVPIGAAPRGALVGRFFVRAGNGIPAVPENHGGDGFPYGQCTYYVAQRRDVQWGGDARTWWYNANGIRPEGEVPVAGAIAVFHNGWAGHVAYVESVHPDGSFVVAEMNFYGDGGGWGRLDHRTVARNDWSLTGFIY